MKETAEKKIEFVFGIKEELKNENIKNEDSKFRIFSEEIKKIRKENNRLGDHYLRESRTKGAISLERIRLSKKIKQIEKVKLSWDATRFGFFKNKKNDSEKWINFKEIPKDHELITDESKINNEENGKELLKTIYECYPELKLENLILPDENNSSSNYKYFTK